jgi:hypothetical protein
VAAADGGGAPVGSTPGFDAGAGSRDAGSPRDAGGTMVTQEPARAGDAGVPVDAGSAAWPARKRRNTEGCTFAPKAGLDGLGVSLLGVWLLLARTRRCARRTAE